MQETLPRKAAQAARTLPQRPSLFNRKTAWGLFLILVVVWAIAQVNPFSGDLVNEGGWSSLMRFFEASLNPELGAQFLLLTIDATLTTLAYAVIGAFFSLILGFFGGVLASESWWEAHFPGGAGVRRTFRRRAPWLAVRGGLAVPRAIHEIIWALFFINIIGLDPLSAILAITIPYGAITAKVFSEILDETSQAPLKALLNSGVSPAKAYAYALIPPALPDLVSYSFYRFECAIRSAAVLGIIGAGGLGYQITLSLQTLNYEQIWTLFYALFALNGAADFWSSKVRQRIGTKRVYNEDSETWLKDISKPGDRSPKGDPLVRFSLAAGVLLVPFSFLYIRPNFTKLLSERAVQGFSEVARLAYPPDFSALPPGEWLHLTQVTLAMSILAVAGAALFSLGLSFPAAGNFLLPGGLLDSGRGGAVQKFLSIGVLVLTRALLLVTRSIPAPIWALILLFVLFPGILPGAAALGFYTFGVLGRLIAEAVENLDDRPLWALKAQGAGGAQVFAYGVLPLTFPRYLGYSFYRWEEALRATVMVGLVGAGGLGRLLTEQLSSFDYQGVLATLIIFIALTFLVDIASASARRAFREP